MKKIFVLLMVLVLFLCACGKTDSNSDTPSNQASSEYTMNENDNSVLSSLEQNLNDEYKKILSRVSTEDKLKLITKNYTEEQIFKSGFFYHRFNIVRGYNPTMSMIEKYLGFKIECLRQCDEDTYYCIFKTKENGYFYCFLRKFYSDFMVYNSCYMKGILDESDFKDIKIGDSIESVTKIDSAFLSIYNYYISVESPLTESVHLLEDGLLIIEYENDIIKKINFNDDFTYSKNGTKYNYKIFKDDYPPQ